MPKVHDKTSSQSNKDRILYLLKTRGELTATVLSQLLNMTMCPLYISYTASFENLILIQILFPS